MNASPLLPTRCALFLVLKAELELARGDSELCESDLQQVLFLLESSTGELPLPSQPGGTACDVGHTCGCLHTGVGG